MPLTLSKQELVDSLRGVANSGDDSLRFSGVEFDSRRVKRGQLFIAIKGEHVHGEAFLDQAFAQGAALALVEAEHLLKTSPHSGRLIAVKNSLSAFHSVAAPWPSHF